MTEQAPETPLHFCRDITNANDRQFCYGVSSHNTSECASIQ